MFINKIRDIFSNELGIQMTSIQDDDNIFDMGIMDSLLTLKLILCLEETFKISIDLAEIEIEDFSSIQNINTFLMKMN